WFGVFENSCAINEIPLEKRYKKLISEIMSPELRSKLLKKSTFFNNINGAVDRYEALRKWLCKETELIASVIEAHNAIKGWQKTEKTLLLNFEKFQEKIDHYVYAIRFAVTHGIAESRFDVATEPSLFKLFVQRVGQDRIRQEAEKYAGERNIAVLKILCKQVDKELSIPLEYQVPARRSTSATAEINVLEDEEYGGDVNFETMTDAEILYYSRNYNYRPSRGQFRKYNNGGYNNRSRKRFPTNNSNYNNNNY
ncbi:MAG: hypothetical protein GY755_24895, partial [Chloroflexi bacterium]|nr:hypothetical protein [Chloroflexota bacterium]